MLYLPSPHQNVYNKLNQSPTAGPNGNYNMLHEVIKLAKDKRYKTVNFKQYKHKEYTWITLAILKYIRYRDKLRNKLKLMHADSHEQVLPGKGAIQMFQIIIIIIIQYDSCHLGIKCRANQIYSSSQTNAL